MALLTSSAGPDNLRVSAGRVGMLVPGYPERPPATQSALLRDPSGEWAGGAGLGAYLCAVGPAYVRTGSSHPVTQKVATVT